MIEIVGSKTGFIYDALSIEDKILKCKNYIEVYQLAIANMPDEINKVWVVLFFNCRFCIYNSVAH